MVTKKLYVWEHLEQDEETIVSSDSSSDVTSNQSSDVTTVSNNETPQHTENTSFVDRSHTRWSSTRWKKWGGDRDKRERKPRRQTEGKKEFEEKMLEVRRVTRVTTWWRQLSFRATMLIGNKNGKIGLGIAKGNDVQSAISKATHDAYKNVVDVSITTDGTVPYPVARKYRAALIKLVPAKPGTGLKAWSSVRSVLELAWYTNILSKIVGTNNILNNALLTIDMISTYKNFSLRFKQKLTDKVEESVADISLEWNSVENN